MCVVEVASLALVLEVAAQPLVVLSYAGIYFRIDHSELVCLVCIDPRI